MFPYIPTFFLAFILLVLYPLPLKGDILYLSNGEKIRAKVLKYDSYGILVEIPGGRIRYGYEEVSKIIEEPEDKYYFEEGKRLLSIGDYENGLAFLKRVQNPKYLSQRRIVFQKAYMGMMWNHFFQKRFGPAKKISYQLNRISKTLHWSSLLLYSAIREVEMGCQRMLAKGKEALEKEDLEKAEEFFRRALKWLPQSYEKILPLLGRVYFKKTKIAFQKEDWKEAYQALFQGLNYSPQKLIQYQSLLLFLSFHYGRNLLEQKKWKEYLDWKEKIHFIHPSSLLFTYLDGVFAQKRRKLFESAKGFSKILKMPLPKGRINLYMLHKLAWAKIDTILDRLKQKASQSFQNPKTSVSSQTKKASQKTASPPSPSSKDLSSLFVWLEKKWGPFYLHTPNLKAEVHLLSYLSYYYPRLRKQLLYQEGQNNLLPACHIYLYPSQKAMKEGILYHKNKKGWKKEAKIHNRGFYFVTQHFGKTSTSYIFGNLEDSFFFIKTLPHLLAHVLLEYGHPTSSKALPWLSEGFALSAEPLFFRNHYILVASAYPSRFLQLGYSILQKSPSSKSLKTPSLQKTEIQSLFYTFLAFISDFSSSYAWISFLHSYRTEGNKAYSKVLSLQGPSHFYGEWRIWLENKASHLFPQ